MPFPSWTRILCCWNIFLLLIQTDDVAQQDLVLQRQNVLLRQGRPDGLFWNSAHVFVLECCWMGHLSWKIKLYWCHVLHVCIGLHEQLFWRNFSLLNGKTRVPTWASQQNVRGIPLLLCQNVGWDPCFVPRPSGSLTMHLLDLRVLRILRSFLGIFPNSLFDCSMRGCCWLLHLCGIQ